MLVEILPFLVFLLLSGSGCVRSTRLPVPESPFTPLHSLERNEPSAPCGQEGQQKVTGSVMRHVKVFITRDTVWRSL